MDHDSDESGTPKSIVCPPMTVFIVPVLSLAFFWHAESKFDREMLDLIEQDIQEDPLMTEEERAGALEFFRGVPLFTTRLSAG